MDRTPTSETITCRRNERDESVLLFEAVTGVVVVTIAVQNAREVSALLPAAVRHQLEEHIERDGRHRQAQARSDRGRDRVGHEAMRQAGRCEAERREPALDALEIVVRVPDDGDVGVLRHAPRRRVKQQLGDECADGAELDLERAQAARQDVGDDGQPVSSPITAGNSISAASSACSVPRYRSSAYTSRSGAAGGCFPARSGAAARAGGSMTRRFPRAEPAAFAGTRPVTA